MNVGIPVLITAAITALILNWTSSPKNETPKTNNEEQKISYELPELNENGDSLWADADKFIPYQIYSIDNTKDTIIEGKDGGIYAIPANAFVDENGNLVKGKIDFELKEAFDTETILKGGLSTTSNGELLETGGMFYLNARKDGKTLKLAEGKNIVADIPGDNSKEGMMLFDGERKNDGSINWINPKPLEKPLVTVDINSLNFYPPQYEDSLSTMTEKAAIKKYRDSLYYSFAGKKNSNQELDVPVLDEVNEKNEVKESVIVKDPIANNATNLNVSKINGERLFNANCASCHRPNFDYTGPSLKGARLRWKNAGYENEIYNWVQNPISLLNKKNPYATLLLKKWKNAGVMVGQGLSKDEIKAVFEYVDSFPSLDLESENSGLNPAKVKSIWNDKFQNTLIATKEFEERMPFIHRLCARGNYVLDMYVNNLDKRISTIDSMVANTLSGSDIDQFLKFAARGEGRVKTDDVLMKKLGKYYDEQTKIFSEAVNKTRNEYYKNNSDADKKATEKTNVQSGKEVIRVVDNFMKELVINLNDAYRQIGKKPTTVNGRVRFSTGTGWNNLDRYVLEATVNRETMNYTDPETGKKAVLKYELLEVKINNVNNYDRVLVYLLPNQLNSFMRMKKEGNLFTEKLNMLFKHELIILAYKDDKSYYKYYEHINPGMRDSINLEEMSEQEINNKLRLIKKLDHTQEMKNDIAYQFFQQKDAKRKAKFLKNEKLMRRIEKVIFPCGDTWKSIDFNAIEEGSIIDNN